MTKPSQEEFVEMIAKVGEGIKGVQRATQDSANGRLIPEPYSYRPPVWLWKRVTGWRDAYGRKAELLMPWYEWFLPDL